MFLLFPFRAVRLLTIGPRILARISLRPRFGLLRTAIVVGGIVALVSYSNWRKGTTPGV